MMRRIKNDYLLCSIITPGTTVTRGNVGKREFHGRTRAYDILKSIQTVRPYIDVERAKYFTESMKETEGQALVLRWAKAMKHVAENITVYIDDNQLIVGRSGKQGRYGILYPELDGDFLDLGIKELPSRTESPLIFPPKTLASLLKM